jgi:hypothetical protein
MASLSGRGVLRQEVFSTKLIFNNEEGSSLENEVWY